MTVRAPLEDADAAAAEERLGYWVADWRAEQKQHHPGSGGGVVPRQNETGPDGQPRRGYAAPDELSAGAAREAALGEEQFDEAAVEADSAQAP
ncbi:hypothetical protein VTH06DRAFT_2220 [Thermothelomyces fergusii]